MKQTFSIIFSFVFVFSLILTPTFAANTDVPRNSSRAAEKKLAVTDASMERLKAKAEKEINRRIESLSKLISRIGEMKKLTTAQKTALTSQVQAEITSLTNLLAKIKADTDLATLRADIKSIVDSYRIYALFMPKIQILGAADKVLNTADQMSSQAARLEAKINEKQTAGQNVTDLQTLLVDMKTKIIDAETQAQSAIDIVTPLTPAGYPDNKSSLQSARAMINTAHKNLKTAHQDARQIIVGLMKLGKLSPSTP